MKRLGFTLVELIVVITILAILGTIAFISLQGYSKTSRDSVRISDVSLMKASLDVFRVGSGKYPETSSGTIIMYNGNEAFTQGVFGNSVIENLGSIDHKPLDPSSYKEYTYSVTKTKQEYQIAGILESDSLGLNVSDNAYAGDRLVNAYIDGNYNGKILRVDGIGLIYLLSVPSLITSDISDTNLVSIVDTNKLIYNKFKNLPENYSSSLYNGDGEGTLILINTGSLVVYSGSLDNLKNEQVQIDIIEKLQESYNSTDIDSIEPIKAILSYDIGTNPEGSKFLSQTIISNNIYSNVEVTAENINIPFNCANLLGDGYNDDISYDFNDFDLCNNLIKISSISNIQTSSNLTGNSGERDVYTFILNEGQEYIFETLGDDSGSDTAMYLFDKDGNKLIMNEDISSNNYRSKFNFTTDYTGYHYIGIMGYGDLGTSADYTLNIQSKVQCGTQPSYSNIEFIEGINTDNGKAWQNTDSSSGCYYKCTNGFSGNDCTVISACMTNLTVSDSSNLNIFFNGTGYNGDVTYWCSLENIDVEGSSISGTIPTELGDLSNLKELNLSDNSLTGTIPTELGNLSKLEVMWLDANTLSGSIPNELGNITSLKTLGLHTNQLTGSIPISLGNLSNLIFLYLSKNQLTGSIPLELGNLSNLNILYIHDNTLSGTIPVELGNMTNLRILYAHRTGISGGIPIELANLPNLAQLFIYDNNLTGIIPPELGNISSLVYLALNNNEFTGTVPSEFGNLSELGGLWIDNNKLSGILPSELGTLSNLNYLHIQNNNFTGAEVGYCNLLLQNSWISPDTNADDDNHRDNPQDSDNDSSYDDTIIFCP